ncbi:hypothetical protein F8M41_005470 [Gigaspora margarita]|uniref:Peptidase S1 domain-containing protein n=1 Tax=Gigaspora margarita TaxID=4874 RepID=A0A8H3X8V5_GIGMA|nr:hypothetical protein F8M41_005470 [Gigaspora margarita]
MALLQSYSIYAKQYHPLAKLWDEDDTEVPGLLKNERNLISIDEILRPILEKDDFISSFGGTYINIFYNCVVVNTVNKSKENDLLNLTQIKPYKDFLCFRRADNSMSQIQHNFNEISLLANRLRPKKLFIYTDMKVNNNVLLIFNESVNNSEFINAIKPFNPTIIYHKGQENPPVSQNLAQSRRDVDSYDLEVRVLGGDGLLNVNTDSQCSVGFWAKSINREAFSIVTAGHCYASGDWSYYPWGSTNSSGILIGPMIFSLKDYYDFGIIPLEYGKVAPTFSIRNDDADQYKELIITGDAPVSSHNVHICKSGYTTHLTCGHVLGLNGIAPGLGDTEEFILYDLIIADFDSLFGDSGGSSFSFVSPQDLYSVVVNGIFSVIGAAIQPIDIIFKELDKRNIYYKLYIGQ